jgi:hypothetical protein
MTQTKRQNLTLTLALAIAACACLLGVTNAVAAGGGTGLPGEEPLPGPPGKAKIMKNGDVLAPKNAPDRVVLAIAVANRINHVPYVWGGGHRTNMKLPLGGCDCSGCVSAVLGPLGADVMSSPLPSGPMMKWGERGRGKWITVYANGGHAYAVIAGLRWDTSRAGANHVVPGGTGPRWAAALRSNAGFVARHPKNL